MIKTRQVQKPVDEIEDIVCNMCGLTCKREENDFEGLIEAMVTCGYGSCLGRGNSYNFSICDTCLKNLFTTFKIAPTVLGVPGGAEDYAEAIK